MTSAPPLMLSSLIVLSVAAFLGFYAYLGYPWLLRLLGGRGGTAGASLDDGALPVVSISVPAFNEEDQIEELIRSLLRIDYPSDKRQILIVSDCSTDATDSIVRKYADQGVELLRLEERGGKNRAENAAAVHLRGDIVVNTDASVRIQPGAVRALVAALADPEVGVASGYDVSVDPGDAFDHAGESSYVGYEMGVRELETRAGGIIGSSGCFYAIRPELHRLPLSDLIDRDFAAVLLAREHGLRAVSVSEARCLVPRTASIQSEYRRKVRTISRGMYAMWVKRHLLNPIRHGRFAWKLWSHKVVRWSLPWVGLAALSAMAVLATLHPVWLLPLGAVVTAALLGALGWALDGRVRQPRLLSGLSYLLMANAAAAHGLLRALFGQRQSLWEPTRRHVVSSIDVHAPQREDWTPQTRGRSLEEGNRAHG